MSDDLGYGEDARTADNLVRPGNGQHEEAFMIRVLVNADLSIRRTTVQHVGTGKEHHWPRLTCEALLDFINSEIAASASPAQVPAVRAPGQRYKSETSSLSPTRTGSQLARPASSAVLAIDRAALRAAEPFTLTMTVDLAGRTGHAGRLAYSAVVVARPIADGPKQPVARSQGVLATTSPTIRMEAPGLPAGVYRLDGLVSLREPGSDDPVGLAAMAEGLLVQVHPR